LLALLRVSQILLIVVTCVFVLVRSNIRLSTILRLTMAPHLGQEPRKNVIRR
jgi:hypothetical protein